QIGCGDPDPAKEAEWRLADLLPRSVPEEEGSCRVVMICMQLEFLPESSPRDVGGQGVPQPAGQDAFPACKLRGIGDLPDDLLVVALLKAGVKVHRLPEGGRHDIAADAIDNGVRIRRDPVPERELPAMLVGEETGFANHVDAVA